MTVNEFVAKLEKITKGENDRKAFKLLVDILTTAANEMHKGDGHGLAGITAEGALVNVTPKIAINFASDENYNLLENVHNYAHDVINNDYIKRNMK